MTDYAAARYIACFPQNLFCTGFGSFAPNQNAKNRSPTPICAFVTIDQSWTLFTPISEMHESKRVRPSLLLQDMSSTGAGAGAGAGGAGHS